MPIASEHEFETATDTPPISDPRLFASVRGICIVDGCHERNQVGLLCVAHRRTQGVADGKNLWRTNSDDIERARERYRATDRAALAAGHYLTRCLVLDYLPALGQGHVSQYIGGYVYIIEFSTGVIKVGMTKDPHGRVSSHHDAATPFGVDITALWLSKWHGNYQKNEQTLLALLPAPSCRREYFNGISFETVVSLAETRLRFGPLAPSVTITSRTTEATNAA